MRIYTTLSSIPPRQDTLRSCLESITKNQTRKPDLTILNICDEYLRFPGTSFNPKNLDLGDCVVLNKTRDRGPLTKTMGFIEYYERSLRSSGDDILIIHDDDFIYDEKLIESLCFPIINEQIDVVTHLYGNGMVMFKERRNSDEVVRANFVYPSLGGFFGIAIRINEGVIKDMRDYVEEIVGVIPSSMYHDDAIISSFLRTRNMRILWLNGREVVSKIPGFTSNDSPLSERCEEPELRGEVSQKILEFLNKC